VGAAVEANYRGKGRYYPGRIGAVNSDGTVNVDYDDGEKESHVSASLVRVLSVEALSEAAVAAVISSSVVKEFTPPRNAMLMQQLNSDPGARLKKVAAPVAHTEPNEAALEQSVARRQVAQLRAWTEFGNDTRIAHKLLDFGAVSMGNLLGRGKFAAVYDGRLTSGSHVDHVAVKVAQFKGNDANNWTPMATPRGAISPKVTAEEIAAALAEHHKNADLPVDDAGRVVPPLACISEFHREVLALHTFADCPHIIKLVGYTLSPLTVVLELMQEGSLYSNLHNELWQVRQHYISDVR
jgi:hypothetical protein